MPNDVIIDSVPTVEVGYLTNCANCEKVEKIRAKRPQGEWGQCYENHKNGMFYRDCSICGKATMTGDFKFCPYCGAKMQKGGAE